MKLLNKTLSTIRKYSLLDENDILILGLSGGADSVCLLNILNVIKDQYNLKLIAVHINHGIRGKEAHRDENFVKNICSDILVPIEIFHYNIKDEAKKQSISEEDAGRKIRYFCFNEVLKKYKGTKIAVAHNLNDNGETMIMNFFRGTGLQGLTGIKPIRGKIIRPLIECSRYEIENYCIQNNIKFMQDSTNFQEIYTRNKVRLNLIPFIQENFNSNLIKSLWKTSEILTSENIFLENIAREIHDKSIIEKDEKNITLSINKLITVDDVIKRRVLRQCLYHFSENLSNISYNHIEDILCLLKKTSNKRLNLPHNIEVRRDFESLTFTLNFQKSIDYYYDILIDNAIYIKEADLYITFYKNIKKYYKNLTNLYTICLKYDKIVGSLVIRNRRSGDKIYIKNINGHKSIKKFFIEKKIPANLRDKIPIFCCDDKIISILGYLTSDIYKTSYTKDENVVFLQLWR